MTDDAEGDEAYIQEDHGDNWQTSTENADQMNTEVLETSEVAAQMHNEMEGEDADASWYSAWFSTEHDTFMAESSDTAEDVFYPNSGLSVFYQKQMPKQKCEPLIDSGASRTVVGLDWLLEWDGVNNRESLKLTPSSRRFKFGSQEAFASLGVYTMIGSLPDARNPHMRDELLAVNADVLDLSIPFLMSQNTLFQLKADLNFEQKMMKICNTLSIPIRVSSSVHLSFEWKFISASVNDIAKQSTLSKVFASADIISSNAEENERMTVAELKKLHVHLGHSDFSSMKRIIDLAGKQCGELVLRRVIQECERKKIFRTRRKTNH